MLVSLCGRDCAMLKCPCILRHGAIEPLLLQYRLKNHESDSKFNPLWPQAVSTGSSLVWFCF